MKTDRIYFDPAMQVFRCLECRGTRPIHGAALRNQEAYLIAKEAFRADCWCERRRTAQAVKPPAAKTRQDHLNDHWARAMRGMSQQAEAAIA